MTGVVGFYGRQGCEDGIALWCGREFDSSAEFIGVRDRLLASTVMPLELNKIVCKLQLSPNCSCFSVE